MLHKSSVRTQWNKLQTSLVRNPFVSPEIMPVDAIVSSRSIYATAPLETDKIFEIRARRPNFDQLAASRVKCGCLAAVPSAAVPSVS
ncbi:MAG: hypothetical protein V3Q69_12025 [Burkholderia sp.]